MWILRPHGPKGETEGSFYNYKRPCNDDGEQQAKVGANLPARFELELVDGYLNRLSLQHCVARPGFTK